MIILFASILYLSYAIKMLFKKDPMKQSNHVPTHKIRWLGGPGGN